MTDIRIFGNVSGDVIIGEYVDTREDTGELIPFENGGIVSNNAFTILETMEDPMVQGRFLTDPMIVLIQTIPPKSQGEQPRVVPMVQPLNIYADTIRGSVGDIDIDANNLVEFNNIGLEKLNFLMNQYNEILTGLDLNSTGPKLV